MSPLFYAVGGSGSVQCHDRDDGLRSVKIGRYKPLQLQRYEKKMICANKWDIFCGKDGKSGRFRPLR